MYVTVYRVRQGRTCHVAFAPRHERRGHRHCPDLRWRGTFLVGHHQGAGGEAVLSARQICCGNHERGAAQRRLQRIPGLEAECQGPPQQVRRDSTMQRAVYGHAKRPGFSQCTCICHLSSISHVCQRCCPSPSLSSTSYIAGSARDM